MADQSQPPPGISQPLSDAEIRWAMHLGTQFALDQARDQIEARTRRVRTQMAEEARRQSPSSPERDSDS